jgi:DNA-binding transcriptional ArsR family regulator
MHGHAMKISASIQQRLACLGDASRYRLVMALASGPRCVSDLADDVGLSQSCTTRHLQALQAMGLVRRMRDGKRVMVQLNRDEPEAGPMLDWVLERVRTGLAPGSGSRGAVRHHRQSQPDRGKRKDSGGRAGPSKDRNGGTPEPEAPAAIETAISPVDSEPAQSNGDEGARQGPFRRPDTIEDYLL